MLGDGREEGVAGHLGSSCVEVVKFCFLDLEPRSSESDLSPVRSLLLNPGEENERVVDEDWPPGDFEGWMGDKFQNVSAVGKRRKSSRPKLDGSRKAIAADVCLLCLFRVN